MEAPQDRNNKDLPLSSVLRLARRPESIQDFNPAEFSFQTWT